MPVDFLNASFDTIAVFDSNFSQVFENARPLRDEVVPRSKLMDHPSESGQIVSDYKITLPVEITIQMLISSEYYRDTYQEIWDLWQQSALLTIQTRVTTFGNMVIAEPPHEETPEIFDAIRMNLKFRQVQTPLQSTTFQPADPTQADTQSIGQQTGSPYVVNNSQSLNSQQNIQSELQ